MKNIFKKIKDIIFETPEEYNERGRRLEEDATKAIKMGDKYGQLYMDKLGIKDSACLRDRINSEKQEETDKLIKELHDKGINI